MHRWLDANGLCLNPNKSEAIVTGTSARQRSEPQIDDATVTDVTVSATRTVRSLGVTIQNTLLFNAHVNNVWQATHFHIRVLHHLPVSVSQWRKDCDDCDGVIWVRLLQLDTYHMELIQSHQVAAHPDCLGMHCHDDEQTWTHHTCVSRTSLASCHHSYPLQNHFNYLHNPITHQTSYLHDLYSSCTGRLGNWRLPAVT